MMSNFTPTKPAKPITGSLSDAILSVMEAKKKIGEYSSGTNVARVYKLSGEHDEGDPYHVKLFKNGKHHEPADYFTNDEEDAHGSAKHMVKESVSTNLNEAIKKVYEPSVSEHEKASEEAQEATEKANAFHRKVYDTSDEISAKDRESIVNLHKDAEAKHRAAHTLHYNEAMKHFANSMKPEATWGAKDNAVSNANISRSSAIHHGVEAESHNRARQNI